MQLCDGSTSGVGSPVHGKREAVANVKQWRHAEQPLKRLKVSQQEAELRGWPIDLPPWNYCNIPACCSYPEFMRRYNITGVIASGVTGSVRAGTRINGDGKLLAIKICCKVSACRQAAFLQICKGPHITELLDSFTSASLTCLVMPYYQLTLKQLLLDSPRTFLKIGGSAISTL